MQRLELPVSDSSFSSVPLGRLPDESTSLTASAWLQIFSSFGSQVFTQEGHNFGYRVARCVRVPSNVDSHPFGGGVEIVHVWPVEVECMRGARIFDSDQLKVVLLREQALELGNCVALTVRVVGPIEDNHWTAGQFAAALFKVFRSEEHTSELQSLRHLVCR